MFQKDPNNYNLNMFLTLPVLDVKIEWLRRGDSVLQKIVLSFNIHPI